MLHVARHDASYFILWKAVFDESLAYVRLGVEGVGIHPTLFNILKGVKKPQ